jgi:FHA domain/Domain of unknown function (DUF1707)
MRPSERDRERVAVRLRNACADERLSLETFAERLNLAYAARNQDELGRLTADLPEFRVVGRAILATTEWLSRWTARLASAWQAPRTPRLVLPTRDLVLLGRARDCDGVLTHATVSRRHAVLTHADGRWLLRDLNSVNGTYVNGWRVIDEVEVRPGDDVRFGEARYRLASTPAAKYSQPSTR